MLKKRILSLIIVFFILINLIFNISYSISVPETDINLKIQNLTRGCNVYLLISENLLRYNMEKFINNNINNVYTIEAKEAEELKKFLDKNDYLGYIDYFRETGFEIEKNEIELRHYCFCLGTSEVIGYLEYDGAKYIQIKINLNDNNEFKLVMKDYLNNYDSSDTKFMIDEYGSITYIDLKNYNFSTNPEQSHVKECNIEYVFYSNEDYDSIEKTTKITYLIIYLILIIIALIILIKLIKRRKSKKEEVEARKFWKKKLTKEEKKRKRKNKRTKEIRKEEQKKKGKK